MPVSSLPSARGDGQPYSAMIDLESKTQISHYVCAKEDSVWLLMQDNGLGFVTTFKDMVSRIKAGKSFISMEEGANLLRPIPVGSSARYIGMLSKNDRFLIVPIQDIKHLNSGGRGTILMGLDPKDKISQVVTVTESGIQATGIYRNKQVEELIALGDLHEYIGKRARKGKTLKLKLKQATLLPLD